MVEAPNLKIEFLSYEKLIVGCNDWQARIKDMWSNHYSRAPKPPAPGQSLRITPKGFPLLQPHSSNMYVVALVEGEVVATATIIPIKTSQKSLVMVEDFIVHERHRRQGYGRCLMNAILQHFDQSEGYFFVQAEPHPSRTGFIGLLEAMHFVQQAEATSNQNGAINVYRYNLFDPE